MCSLIKETSWSIPALTSRQNVNQWACENPIGCIRVQRINGHHPMVVIRRARQPYTPKWSQEMDACRKAETITERPSLRLHTLKNTITDHNIYRGTYRVPFYSFAKISHTIEKGTEIKQMYGTLINTVH